MQKKTGLKLRQNRGMSLIDTMIGMAIAVTVLGTFSWMLTTVFSSANRAEKTSSRIGDIQKLVKDISKQSICARNFVGRVPSACVMDGRGSVTGGATAIADLFDTDGVSIRPSTFQGPGYTVHLCQHPEMPDYVARVVIGFPEIAASGEVVPRGISVPVNISLDSAGQILDCGISFLSAHGTPCPTPSATPTPTATPTPAPGCTGVINFTGSVKVNESYGAGSAGDSCKPLIAVNYPVPVPPMGPGSTYNILGLPPWPSSYPNYTGAIATFDDAGCDRSFIFASLTLTCDATSNLSFTLNSITYRSGRIDEGIYELRATIDPATSCTQSGGIYTCSGNDHLNRITVNPGFTVQHNP